jgi:hypothetical protein
LRVFSFLTDSGQSTLSTNGHVYNTDAYTYYESTAETDNDSEASANGNTNTGYALDSYLNQVTGSDTVTDSSTTSLDTYTLYNSHYISGYEAGSSSNTLESDNWNDIGTDDSLLSSQGTKSTSGDNDTFYQVDSTFDQFLFGEVE